MSEIQLLSCPCCDSENLEIGSKPCFVGEDIYIQCNTCGVKLQICEEYGWEELYKRWNTRKPMERIVEKVEKCVEWDGYTLDIKKRILEICKEEGGINVLQSKEC